MQYKENNSTTLEGRQSPSSYDKLTPPTYDLLPSDSEDIIHSPSHKIRASPSHNFYNPPSDDFRSPPSNKIHTPPSDDTIDPLSAYLLPPPSHSLTQTDREYYNMIRTEDGTSQYFRRAAAGEKGRLSWEQNVVHSAVHAEHIFL